jgi:hypothetical protein
MTTQRFNIRLFRTAQERKEVWRLAPHVADPDVQPTVPLFDDGIQIGTVSEHRRTSDAYEVLVSSEKPLDEMGLIIPTVRMDGATFIVTRCEFVVIDRGRGESNLKPYYLEVAP